MKHSVKKRILTLVMAVVVALGVFPAGTVFAAADAEAVRGLSVVPGKTTQQNIDTAWGEGTAEFTESEGVYTLKLLKNLEMEGELVLGTRHHSDQYVLGSIGKVPSPAEQLELTGGQFNIDPTAYADDVPVAEVVSKGGDSKGFFIGKKTEEAASQVESGDQIVVKKGDAVLEGLPKDVIVKNEGDGSVTAHGNTVLPGTSVQIQDSAAEEPSLPAISSINGWKLRRNTDWYYYKNGKTVTGWIELEGILFYLDETGKMATPG